MVVSLFSPLFRPLSSLISLRTFQWNKVSLKEDSILRFMQNFFKDYPYDLRRRDLIDEATILYVKSLLPKSTKLKHTVSPTVLVRM